jgi:uncharacterized membrane protein
MARVNRRAVRWLRGELPDLVASGTVTPEAADAIRRHYDSRESSQANFGFVLLAIVGSVLIGAGVILLIAHNWDELSRPLRSTIALAPLIGAEVLGVFVLLRRDESPSWRESVAICIVATLGTAISLISQTYQIQGSFADFMCLWMLLSLPIVYLFRTTVGAVAYVIGTVTWLFAKAGWRFNDPAELCFWLLLLAIVPYYILLLRRDRASAAPTFLSILLVAATAIGLGCTAELTRANLGGVAYAGLFTSIYLCGMRFFPRGEGQRLHPLSLVGGLGIGVTAIVLSFEWMWHLPIASMWSMHGAPQAIGIAVELFFPAVAVALLAWIYGKRQKTAFSIAAAIMPLVAGLALLIANLAPPETRGDDSAYSMAAAIIFNVYALALGIELIARGVRANSVARANFGLLIIAALAMCRFFDSDLGFVTRGLGFIIVGVGFLVANVIFFKKRKGAA